MGPSRLGNIDAIRRAVTERKAELDRLGVASLAVFGSVARDEAGPESDIDILVEFRGAATLSRFMDLKSLLETAFGRRVDLVTQKALRERLRPVIEKDAVRVA
jgi:predicted nucleotidyltransferase